jgi:hypothetical protein
MEAIVLVAILNLAPWLSHDQAISYAKDIAKVCNNNVPLCATLTVVANAEGSFTKAVETCKIVGDEGKAISLYQLHPHFYGRYTPEEICSNNRLATSIAGKILYGFILVAGVEGAFKLYAGITSDNHPKIVKRMNMYNQTYSIMTANESW